MFGMDRPGKAVQVHGRLQKSGTVPRPSSQAETHAGLLHWQVVGEKEKAEKLVNVRTRDQQRHGMHALPDVIAQLCKERDGRHLTSTFGEHLQQGASLKPEAATDATAAQAAATSFNVNEETRAVAAAAGQQ